VTTLALSPAPGTQGPGPTPSYILEALDLALVRRAAGTLPGEHRAPGVGAGTELAQLRVYQPGDDVRQLDPAASARTGLPHVRLHVPERLMTAWIVLDVSPSMAFGTGLRLKSDVAGGAAAVLARLSVRRGGRAGLVLCGGRHELVIPPRSGRRAAAAIEHAVGQGVVADGAGDDASLGRALSRLSRLARSPGMVAVVSDFRAARGWARPLRALGHRHSLVAVEVSDPREASLPSAGVLRLVDPESGRQIEADTRDAALRERYAEREQQRRAAAREELRTAGAEIVDLTTGDPWLAQLGRRLR
jgi:uncharacterized protein (DUF58 family)